MATIHLIFFRVIVFSAATRTACLRRAIDRTERAKYAAVARLRFEQLLAVRALVKENAGISRHVFRLLKTAVRTRDSRLVHLSLHVAVHRPTSIENRLTISLIG